MQFLLGALAAFAFLTLLVGVGGVAWWFWVTQRAPAPAAAPAPDNSPRAPEPSADWWAQLQALAYVVHDLEARVKGLPGLWTEEADRAHRAAERASKAERRARALAPDEAEEPDDDQLSFEHGDGSARSGMRALSNGVARPDEQKAYLMEVRRQIALMPLKGN